MTTTTKKTLDRRAMLARTIWGSAGAVAATTAVGLTQPAAAHPWHRTMTVDVACLLNGTFTFIGAPDATDPDTDFRGTTFYVEGELYPSHTLPSEGEFEIGSAEPIGHWMCRGWFINTPGRPNPHVITTQEYLLQRITPESLFPTDQLVSSGLEGSAMPQVSRRSVVGGAGRYAHTRGDADQHTLASTNSDGGPNFRFRFHLKRH